ARARALALNEANFFIVASRVALSWYMGARMIVGKRAYAKDDHSFHNDLSAPHVFEIGGCRQ
ncbi:MAG: hypothetical protein WBE89_04105, partial [Methyloceanibacter sp.]